MRSVAATVGCRTQAPPRFFSEDSPSNNSIFILSVDENPALVGDSSQALDHLANAHVVDLKNGFAAVSDVGFTGAGNPPLENRLRSSGISHLLKGANQEAAARTDDLIFGHGQAAS